MIKDYMLAQFISLLLIFSSCTSSAGKTDSVKTALPDTASHVIAEPEKVMTEQEIEKQKLKAACESWVAENVNKDFLTGKVKRQNNSLFINLESEHTDRNIYLIQPVYEAYKKMYEAALADSIKLRITSGHRIFSEQVIEWELRWNNPRTEITFRDETEKAKFILQYRAMPGTTRHHWGTDIDINSFELSYWETKTGQKVYEWLKKYAGDYGFYQPYTAFDEKRPHGYNEEKWHWSYKPLSRLMLERYLELVVIDDITGFKGDAAAKKLPIITEWVCGINPQLKDEE